MTLIFSLIFQAPHEWDLKVWGSLEQREEPSVLDTLGWDPCSTGCVALGEPVPLSETHFLHLQDEERHFYWEGHKDPM